MTQGGSTSAWAWRSQLKRNAAAYWRRQVCATCQDDVPGRRCRDVIGVDKMMWGSDYPHFSRWKRGRKALW